MNDDHDDWFLRQYRRYQKPIGAFIRSKIPNPETAADITQDVFLKLFRFQGAYRDKYSFSTWLWTIARNTVADYIRSQAVRGAQLVDGRSPEEIASPARGPEALILRRDRFKALLKQLRCLTHLQRRVVWMRFVKELSYEEISKRLGLSLNAAKNLTYRARISVSTHLIAGRHAVDDDLLAASSVDLQLADR